MILIKKKHGIFIAALLLLLFPALLLCGTETIEKEKILKTGQEWQDNYKQYRVDPSLIDTIKSKTADNLKIDVYLGTWCSDSRNNVPKFMKIIDALGHDHQEHKEHQEHEAHQDLVPVKYYNVGRKPNQDVKYYVKELKVERVPTFIFYREGKEIGRIVENPKTTLIEDFLEIVF